MATWARATLTIADSSVVTAGPVVIATNTGAHWNTQHRHGRGRSRSGAWHAHCAERRIWRWNRDDQFQSHVRRLRGCACDQQRQHYQYACGLHHARESANIYSSATNVEAGTLRAQARRLDHVRPEFGSDGREQRNARSQWLQSDRIRADQFAGRMVTLEGYRVPRRARGLDDDQICWELAARWPINTRRSGATARPPTNWSSAAARVPGNTTVHAADQYRRGESG